MAKRSRNKRSLRRSQRDVKISKASLAPRLTAALVSEPPEWRRSPGVSRILSPVPVSSLGDLEDRRTWRPEAYSPPRGVSLSHASVGLSDRSYRRAGRFKINSQTLAVRAFDSPRYLPVCVRRSRRKQVLHALGKVGKGSGGSRRRHNEFSSISCRK